MKAAGSLRGRATPRPRRRHDPGGHARRHTDLHGLDRASAARDGSPAPSRERRPNAHIGVPVVDRNPEPAADENWRPSGPTESWGAWQVAAGRAGLAMPRTTIKPRAARREQRRDPSKRLTEAAFARSDPVARFHSVAPRLSPAGTTPERYRAGAPSRRVMSPARPSARPDTRQRAATDVRMGTLDTHPRLRPRTYPAHVIRLHRAQLPRTGPGVARGMQTPLPTRGTGRVSGC